VLTFPKLAVKNSVLNIPMKDITVTSAFGCQIYSTRVFIFVAQPVIPLLEQGRTASIWITLVDGL
jgi:hypothetical protein